MGHARAVAPCTRRPSNRCLALIGRATPLPGTSPDVGATPPAVPKPTPTPAPAFTPNVFATEKPLREVARVEAVARDYSIALAGSGRERGTATYHLSLTQPHNPHVNRLRDLWVDTTTYATV